MKKIVGIHAHPSNIAYVEKLFANQLVMTEQVVIELQGTISQQKASLEQAISDAMAEDVIGFIITCTVYASLIEKNDFNGVPILRIEEPLLQAIVQDGREKVLMFSNPGTVELTTRKVEQLYQEMSKVTDYQIVLIPDSFELILSDQKEAYRATIVEAIQPYLERQVTIYLMQLSMSLMQESESGQIKTVFGAAKAIFKNIALLNRWMENNTMKKSKIYTMTFASVYPLYVKKVEKKGRTQAEVDIVICWLTGYDQAGLQQQIDEEVNFEIFFQEAPQLNPNVSLITGMICGYRVEEIEEPLMKKIRYMDKLIDELAKGKAMEKILRH